MVSTVLCLEDFRLRQTELVDALLYVTHHKQIVTPFDQADNLFLEDIGILVFVDEDMVELVAVIVGRLTCFQNFQVVRVVPMAELILLVPMAAWAGSPAMR